MNLKAAANQLGVHYQTAYKWVRNGDLCAVRIGGRYDVSDAAIEQFKASRRSAANDALSTIARHVPTDESQHLLESLEAFALEPFVTLPSVVSLAARTAVVGLGDLSVVAHCDSDGLADCVIVDHQNPDEAARLAGALVLSAYQLTAGDGLASQAFHEQRTVRVSHVPQDWIRRVVQPELRQHFGDSPFHSLLIAPIVIAGSPVGVIVLSRRVPCVPYSQEDESFIERLAERTAALFETALETETAWTVRRKVVAELTDLAARGTSDATPVGLAELIDRHAFGTGLPVAVLDHEGRFVVVNDVAARTMGYQRERAVGVHFESFVHPDELTSERANFERLRSGELDFLDTHARRATAEGTELAYASHRAAVRDASANLRFVVSVARPLHISPDDYGALRAAPKPAAVPSAYGFEVRRSPREESVAVHSRRRT